MIVAGGTRFSVLDVTVLLVVVDNGRVPNKLGDGVAAPNKVPLDVGRGNEDGRLRTESVGRGLLLG